MINSPRLKKRKHSKEEALDLIDKGAGYINFNYFIITNGAYDEEIHEKVQIMCEIIKALYGEMSDGFDDIF